MADPYPLLKADIFYAKLRTPTGFEVRLRNTTTGEDLTATPLMVVVLELCTGTSTVTDIIAQLYRRPGSPPPELIQSITTLMTQLQVEGIITLSETPLRTEKLREIRLEYPLKRAQIEITNRCNLPVCTASTTRGIPVQTSYPLRRSSPSLTR